MAIRTDFSSIQKAIQDAFDTYWKVKENKADRGERVKDREQRMRELQMTLSSAETTAAEKIKAEKELESLRQTGAINLETQKAGIATDIYNRPDEASMRAANIYTTRELGGMYSRSPRDEEGKELIDAQTQVRLTWPTIQEEANKLGRDLLTDIMTLDYKLFSQKHVAMMDQKEFDKLKAGGFSAQNKWALNKAIDYVTPKYRGAFEGAKIGKEFDSYMAGFKATWQPDVAELLATPGGTNKPVFRLPTPEDIENTKKGFLDVGERIKKGLNPSNWFGR
jgi:hypothetical protein